MDGGNDLFTSSLVDRWYVKQKHYGQKQHEIAHTLSNQRKLSSKFAYERWGAR